MNDTVTPLRPDVAYSGDPAAKEEAIKLARHVLEMAEAGHLDHVAVAWVSPDGWSNCISTSRISMALLGATTQMQHRLNVALEAVAAKMAER